MGEVKQINFLETDLQVPDWSNWIACDSDGPIVAFENEPSNEFGFWGSYGEVFYVAKINIEGINWKETLKEL